VAIRLHVAFPLVALGLLLLVEWESIRAIVAGWGLIVLLTSVVISELARVAAALRVGGDATTITIAPVGGLSRIDLPADPPAHLVAALVGPMTFFVLMVAAGCGLAIAGDREVLALLINPLHPKIDPGYATFDPGYSTHYVGQLFVWVNWCLLLISLLPVDPCAGASLLRGVLWPIVGRTSATTAASHVAVGMALLFAAVSVFLAKGGAGDSTWGAGEVTPSWFPFALAAVFLLFGGLRTGGHRRYDVGIAIDEFDSDDEKWLVSEWVEEDRQAVLVEHLQDKQQEALDRKRREREAYEDARVDDILERMSQTGFDQLSDEEQAVLKRASRRYRRRHHGVDGQGV
jgi:hypothetical protein